MNTSREEKLGIWGSISAQRPTEARNSDENMDGQMYCDIFSGELKRSIGKLHDEDERIDQQDLTPWHTHNTVKAKMKKTKVKVLDCPTKSPDLSPIELVWNILDKKLMSTRISNKATVRKRLEVQ